MNKPLPHPHIPRSGALKELWMNLDFKGFMKSMILFNKIDIYNAGGSSETNCLKS